jgi:nitric oxide dioxygenase
MNTEHQKYIVVDKVIHTESIFTLHLALQTLNPDTFPPQSLPQRGPTTSSIEYFRKELIDRDSFIHPEYNPGQYINIYLPNKSSFEGKSYSLSSAPEEKKFVITVKAIGEFSNYLAQLRVGDFLTASLPHGYFAPEKETSQLFLIAAGIGVTPFRSIIKSSCAKNPSRKISLFHSVKQKEDIVFFDEFETVKKAMKNFTTKYFLTQEEEKMNYGKSIEYRRIQAEDVLAVLNSRGKKEKFENLEILICGSISFTRDMWKMLKNADIPEDIILTEAFF